MFAKLLKYEWKATFSQLGIQSLVAVSCGVMGGIILRFIMGYANSAAAWDSVGAVIMTPLSMLLVFLILALIIYMVAVQIILLHRFYKNKFTDEGYLTFTLPVSSHQIFLSSLTNMLIWSLLAGIVLGLSILLMLCIGILGVEDIQWNFSSFFDAYSEELTTLQELPGYLTYRLLSLLGGIVDWFSSPIVMMSCITVGAVLAKKHKILTAIGAYYILSVVTGIVTETLSGMIALDEYYNSAMIYGTGSLAMQGVQILLSAGLAAGGYFLSVHLMDKKLNLS